MGEHLALHVQEKKNKKMGGRLTFIELKTLSTLFHSIHLTVASGMGLLSHFTKNKPEGQKG